LFKYTDDDLPVVAVVEISALKRTNLDILRRVIKEVAEAMEDSIRPSLTVVGQAKPNIAGSEVIAQSKPVAPRCTNFFVHH
jgi:hypothetical protein